MSTHRAETRPADTKRTLETGGIKILREVQAKTLLEIIYPVALYAKRAEHITGMNG